MFINTATHQPYHTVITMLSKPFPVVYEAITEVYGNLPTDIDETGLRQDICWPGRVACAAREST